MNNVNPKLNKGDRIYLVHMDDPYPSVYGGDEGTVIKAINVLGVDGYDVKWDNGSNLSIWSDVDVWMKVDNNEEEGQITESNDEVIHSNEEIITTYDIPFFYQYLEILRKTGLVNMFGAAPYLYIGKKRLKVELDYKDIDITEPIEELLGLADESQSQMVNGAIERLEKLNKEVTPETINRMIQKDSSKIVSVFISIH
jgi:hypothetical protein